MIPGRTPDNITLENSGEFKRITLRYGMRFIGLKAPTASLKIVEGADENGIISVGFSLEDCEVEYDVTLNAN